MKKTVSVVYENVLKALINLGYYQTERGWRRSQFHLTLRRRRRGRVTIDMHMDIYPAYPILGGHRVKEKGEELDKEFHQIMAAYKEQREKCSRI